MWIFNNVSTGDKVKISNFKELSAEFEYTVVAEGLYFVPGKGYIEVFILEYSIWEKTLRARYDKYSGLLMNATFYYNAGNEYYTYRFNGITNANIGYVVNDHKPRLTEGKVSPTSGTQATLFNFSVVYSDADNTFPACVNVTVNGTAHQMTKVHPSDMNYADGCVYQYLGYLASNPFNYTYHFNCSEWKYSNYTQERENLEVLNSNDNAPTLTDLAVDPEIHDSTKKFNFTVNYTDADNNLPILINVTINSTTYLMKQVDPSDTIVNGGKLYYCNRTLSNGFYQFQVRCFDGKFTTCSAWIQKPEVNPFYYPVNTSRFEDNFESGPSQWSQISGLWHLSGGSSHSDPYHSASNAMWYGQESTGTYDTGTRTYGYLTTNAIDLTKMPNAFLEFYHWRIAESDSDYSYVQISSNGVSFNTIATYSEQTISPWEHVIIDITAYCNKPTVYIRFYFETYDQYGNGFRGWYIDDMRVYSNFWGQTITLTSPSDGQTINSGSNQFKWDSMEESFGSVAYTLQVSNTSSFSSIFLEATGIPETPSETIATIAINLQRGTYYWRVRGTYQQFVSRWSYSNYFILKTPPGSFRLGSNVSNGIDVDGNFTLNWTSSSNAVQYKVYLHGNYIIEINDSMSDPIANISILNLKLRGLVSGTYYFIVQATNEDGSTLSNCIKIIVTIPAQENNTNGEDDNNTDDLGDQSPPYPEIGIILVTLVPISGGVIAIIIIYYKKFHSKKSS